MWEFMATTSAQEWEQRKFYCDLYRVDPRRGGRLSEGYLRAYVGPFTIGEIRNEWGGCDFEKNVSGCFRALIKEDGKMIYGTGTGDFYIEGPPKYPTQSQVQTASNGSGLDAEFIDDLKRRASKSEDLEKELITLKASRPAPEAENASLKLMSTTFETALAKIATAGNNGPQSELINTMMVAAVKRLLEPPAAPVASSNPLEMLNTIGAVLPGEGSTLEKLVVLMSRGDNEPAWMPLVERAIGMLPAMADKVITGLREYRMIAETQAGLMNHPAAGGTADVAASRVPDPTMPPQPKTTVPPEQPPPSPAAAPGGVVNLPLEWFEQRIARMIAQGADGEDVAGWLFNTDPRVLLELGQYSAEQLLGFFQSQPILAVVVDNPRLPQILNEFVSAVQEFKKSGEEDDDEDEDEGDEEQPEGTKVQ
jgi:hypothetical protein